MLPPRSTSGTRTFGFGLFDGTGSFSNFRCERRANVPPTIYAVVRSDTSRGSGAGPRGRRRGHIASSSFPSLTDVMVSACEKASPAAARRRTPKIRSGMPILYETAEVGAIASSTRSRLRASSRAAVIVGRLRPPATRSNLCRDKGEYLGRARSHPESRSARTASLAPAKLHRVEIAKPARVRRPKPGANRCSRARLRLRRSSMESSTRTQASSAMLASPGGLASLIAPRRPPIEKGR